VREGGEVLQAIELDRGCFACVLGGPDRKTLFLVANEFSDSGEPGAPAGQVLSVEAPAPGLGWP
jgi:sugar lactone lactonase YvrE